MKLSIDLINGEMMGWEVDLIISIGKFMVTYKYPIFLII